MINRGKYWIEILRPPEAGGPDKSIAGKWLCFGPKEELHLYADLLNTLVEEGEFHAAKIAQKDPQTDPLPHKPCVICVFTSEDEDEKGRIERKLREIGLTPSEWKSEIETQMDWEPRGKLALEAVVVEQKKKLTDPMEDRADRPTRTLARIIKPYKGSAPFAFVSYSHEDHAVVYPEMLRLHQSGYRLWYDEGIAPSRLWTEEIAEALERSGYFLVFITPRAAKSQFVQMEINFAFRRKKPFLAVYLEETQLPLGLEIQMGIVQAIMRYALSEKEYWEKVLEALPDKLR